MDREQLLQKLILQLLDQRSHDSSICPSEAARATGRSDWRSLMPEARRAAADLASQKLVRVTQGDQEVDPLVAKGPIRIRKPHEPEN